MIQLGISSLRSETRAADYTDAVVRSIIAAVGGSVAGDPAALGALEIAAGLWGRAFASAVVKPQNIRTAGLTAPVLSMIGRQLCRSGEAVLAIDVDGDRLSLLPCATWDITGGPRESRWVYRVDLAGASEWETKTVPGPGVIHCRYAVSPGQPWRGLGPLQWAASTGSLAANLEQRLGEEAGASVGAVMPLPEDGGTEDENGNDSLSNLRADLKAGKGRLLTVETTAGGWAEGKSAAPVQDWKQRRFGADPPETLEVLRSSAGLTVLAACGVPPSLAALPADGSGQRESWRRFLHGTVAPVAEIAAVELRAKLEVPDLALGFDGLFASDLMGRARAFQSMVKAGLETDRAAALAGLMEGGE